MATPVVEAVALRTVSGRRLRELVLDRTRDAGLAHEVDVVSQVLPFKVSSYVVDQLIDWDRAPSDGMYRLVFPHRDMLEAADFAAVESAMRTESRAGLRAVADSVRDRLNPHPGDQITLNVPGEDGQSWGLQHKYRETLLVFPRHGQTCHSYCGYCFRWAQFVDRPDLRQAVSGPEVMTDYLRGHPEIVDVLLTGGDPLVMRTELIRQYLEPLLRPEHDHVQTVRIGTKAISFWPHRLLAGGDADELLRLLERMVLAGKHVALMLHLSHPAELSTDAARDALRRLSATGAVLRSQAPVVRHVNDDAHTWAQLWQSQVRHGVVPYYMFVERDTGARRYFGLPIARALETYQGAVRALSGLGRTARGPVMSTSPGKVAVDGITQLHEGPAFALRFLQARDPDLVGRPFHAVFDPRAQWWDELTPYATQDAEFFAGGIR
ncbi:KamA family radical SAM protein [Amycolatopsis sp. NBC_01286]|uniref:KamA family radical SAM protein n=1 Tax=Amycolatopsis sp. NBC_01286 TaxID=2903560 RepID=UPI002E168414|nr:lysine 2,3-aminomutase [Amycolatopsis sp. NBC_01286]